MSEFDDERARALEYRRKERAKEADRLARERALHGDSEAYNQLLARQSALREWLGWSPEKRVHGDAK